MYTTNTDDRLVNGFVDRPEVWMIDSLTVFQWINLIDKLERIIQPTKPFDKLERQIQLTNPIDKLERQTNRRTRTANSIGKASLQTQSTKPINRQIQSTF